MADQPIDTTDQQAATVAQEAMYLIRKGGYFYRPNAQGYTTSKAEAGRYTLADAIAHSHPNGPDGPRDGMDYMLADEPAASSLSFVSSASAEGREERLRMFLEILSASGGQQDASDTRWNWINAFCGEHEGRDPDTFNLAEQRGYTTVSHNTDTDEGMVYLTASGRAYLATQPATSQEGEALATRLYERWADNEFASVRDLIVAALAATPTPPTLSEDLREVWRTDVEAAPRDGTRLLLMWHDHENLPPHIELGKFGSAVKGWCNTYGKAFSGDPTHWMALPPSPAAVAQVKAS